MNRRVLFLWLTLIACAGAAQLDVGYYPYHKKLRARAVVTDLTAAQPGAQARVVLIAEGNTNELASATASIVTNLPLRRADKSPAEGRFVEAILDTTDLPAGNYVVTMMLDDAPPLRQMFTRTKWEWENNQLGMSRGVVPPFTPLKVRGRVVESVLREHTMNGFGLWSQVVAKGEPILARPMRLEVEANKDASSEANLSQWQRGTLRFVEKAADRVATESVFEGGPIHAQVTSEFDYDGMMKVTLDLAATGKRVDSLALTIPLRAKIASLMHISGDSIRRNPTGRIPPGKGVVWQSKGAIPRELGYGGIWGTFLPYVWLGGTERGICWFADSDRDWSLDDDKSALEIVRERGAVTLRVHLINKPTILDLPRRIVFGLQATPVKPMPENWRAWNFFSYTNAVVHSILAQAQIWGGEEPDFSVYPRKRDFSIFEEMARGRKARNMNMGWVDSSGWLDGYSDQKKRAEYRSDVISGFSTAGSADKVIVYFNPRGGEDSLLMPESLNYNPRPLLNNEWNEPVPSWQDFALFYLGKMIATNAVDGVYYDNVYATANYDTISGEAYVAASVSEQTGQPLADARGYERLQPSMGIFNMRALMKRTATMMHEMGKKPLIVAHMTNAAISPILSFATFGLDFEDKYGVTDFQDRFSSDFILAESIGLQAGLVPAGLGGMITNDVVELKRISRTFFGVALVHEIKPWGYFDSDELHRANRPLYEFGYGQDDCRVWRYWDAEQPVRVTGGDAKALVLARAGKALVVVTDFSGGGEYHLRVDVPRLRLPKGFVATDAQTGEALPVTARNISLTIPKHDFKMILLQ
jgi:hypothetical protein